MHIALGGCLKGPPVVFGITADTGGHIAYVLEAALAQGAIDGVEAVTLVTRLFEDQALGPAYAQETEPLADNVFIRRVGTANRHYLEKEALAEDLENFIRVFLEDLRVPRHRPDVIHAHFADAAAVALAARDTFGIPFVYTPHALGLDKRSSAQGGDALALRIAAERRAIARADAIIVSSQNEVDRQIAAYRVAGVRERIRVIAPGIPTMAATSASKSMTVFKDPTRPLVLAIARPTRKKNLIALVKAFATSALRDVANLAILAGQQECISRGGEADDVVRELEDALGSPHLEGCVYFPETHTSGDVAALYRHAAALGGVFVNPALHEPFGLTLLEAAGAGLPVVATRNGGAADIVEAIGHGYLVDPEDQSAIGAACLRIVTDPVLHKRLSDAASRNRGGFSWRTYASRSVGVYADLLAENVYSKAPPQLVICDIDGTLTGCRSAAAAFSAWAESRRAGFIVATGRSLGDARSVLSLWGLPDPDAFITDVGTRIHSRDAKGDLTEWTSFTASLDTDWDRTATADLCCGLGLAFQSSVCQNAHKVSLLGDANDAETVRHHLARAGLAANVVHSHARLIDVLAPHAGKASAVQVYARSRHIRLRDCVAAGDSGNDRDMLERCGAAIVVGNALPELRTLAQRPGLIRARGLYAAGVLEGLLQLGLMNRDPAPAPASDRMAMA